ncbi:hypothetical protein F4802DRAFT_332204 [Xylaria palmicola]|nr:hypothetical protein F4802DRAFT_332204 [Xylaria palmicola]
MLCFPMYYDYNGKPAPTPVSASHAPPYPYGPFETGGGGPVMLGLQSGREWLRLCEEVLGLPNRSRTPIHKQLPTFGNPRGAPANHLEYLYHHVKDMQGLWIHEQLRARSRWTEVETSNGTVPTLLPRSMADARMDKVPAVGEQNAEILAELGLDP